jgi:hypothetical protein
VRAYVVDDSFPQNLRLVTARPDKQRAQGGRGQAGAAGAAALGLGPLGVGVDAGG